MSRDRNLPVSNNLVVEGFQNDNEILLQPKNAPRNVINMRLESDGENRFSYTSIKGNKLSFELCQDGFTPIGACTLKDITEGKKSETTLVVISTATEGSSGGAGEIGTVTFDEKGEGTYTPVYHHDDLNLTKDFPVINECKAIRESDNIKRFYWTDCFNKPRVLNFASLNRLDHTTFDFTSAENIGKQYMVVKGVVSLSGTGYGPGEVAGQVFTSTAVAPLYASDDIVVPYIEIETLDWQIEKGGASIIFDEIITGALNAGSYQYAYRLRSSQGYVTQWSALCRPVPVVPSNVGATVASYQDYEGASSNTRTTKGNRITVSNIDQVYDEIEIVSIRATGENVTAGGEIIFRGAITGTSMDIDHRGDENLGTVSNDELLAIVNVIKKTRSIEANFNHLFAANNELNQELGDFDPSNAMITPFIKEFLSDEVGETGGTSPPLWGHDAVTQNETIQRYDGAVSGVVNQTIAINNDFTDYKGHAVSKHFKGYMRGETYRIGFLPFDKEGNPMFVRWIGDVTIPVQSDNTSHSETWEIIRRSGDDVFLRVCGLKIAALDITEIAEKISGFCIVRAPRDEQRISQGYLWPVTQEDGTSPLEDYPSSATALTADAHFISGSGNNRTANTYLYHSPEHLFSLGGYVDFPITSNQDEVIIENYYDSTYQGATIPGQIGREVETTNRHYYQKFNTESVPTGAKPVGSTATINDFITVSSNETVTNYLSTGRTFINNSRIRPSVWFAEDGAIDIGDREGIGMPAVLMEIDNGETPGSTMGSEAGFGAYNSALDTEKPIVSIITPKGALYGGTSDAAKANTQYIFAGHFQEINDSVLADIDTGGGTYVFTDIEVFGGDIFICLMDIARTIKDNFEEDSGGTDQISQAIVVPLESKINIGFREGRTIARDGSFEWAAGPTITNPDGVGFTTSVGDPPTEGPAQPEQFIYNAAYSQDESEVFYSALPINFTDNFKRPVDVAYSPEKVIGEIIDSWRSFPVNNVKSLEVINGEITNIRQTAARMYYWQNEGLGYLPVNERVVIGGAIGGQTQLGVGGIIDRYDERSRYVGNQNTHGLSIRPDGFNWFDYNKRAFMDLTITGELAEISVIKGLHNLFHERLQGDIAKNDNPILNKGIVTAYDPRFKEILMTFKVQESQLEDSTSYQVGDIRGYGGFNYKCIVAYTTGIGIDPDPGINTTNWELIGKSEFTIGYMPTFGKFSGDYSINSTFMIRTDSDLLMATHGSREVIKDNTDYQIGDVITEGDDNYVAITNFTSANPATAPSADPTNWTLVNKNKEFYVHRRGDVCKFFGIVNDNLIDIVVNDSPEEFKVFDTFELNGTDNMFETVTYRTSYQEATDSDADDTYRFENRAHKNGIALQDGFERMRDDYMEVEMVKDNKLNNDPTTSENKLTKVTSLKIGFRFSK